MDECTTIHRNWATIIGFTLCNIPYVNQKHATVRNAIHVINDNPETFWSIQTFNTCGIVISGPNAPTIKITLSINLLNLFGWG